MNQAPRATLDGSGVVIHDISAVCRVAGSNDAWIDVPGRHQDICVPVAELEEMLAQPSNNAKVAAYKAALARNLNTFPVAIQGWGFDQLETLMDANDRARAARDAADLLITQTFHLVYPFTFA